MLQPWYRRISISSRSYHFADTVWGYALTLYLVFRLLLSSLALWLSHLYPVLNEERTLAVWPPGADTAAWIERIVLVPTVRYDVGWYTSIAEHGYAIPGSTAFHPLYPLLIHLLSPLAGGNLVLTGWLISQICCLLMLVLLYKLVRLDEDELVSRHTLFFLMASPLGFAFLLVYTEALLLLCIVGAFYAARRGRWWLAGIAGAGAALTKQPGVLVFLPLLYEFWVQQRERGMDLRREWRRLLRPLTGLALIPLALLGFLGYRMTLGDATFDFRDPQSFFGGLMVTPQYAQVWEESFGWPWQSLELAFATMQTSPNSYLILNTIVMLVMLLIIIISLRWQRGSYRIYSIGLSLLNLTILYPFSPYMGIIRRFTIIFPLFIQLARWSRRRMLFYVISSVSLILWFYIAGLYVRNAFVP